MRSCARRERKVPHFRCAPKLPRPSQRTRKAEPPDLNPRAGCPTSCPPRRGSARPQSKRRSLVGHLVRVASGKDRPGPLLKRLVFFKRLKKLHQFALNFPSHQFCGPPGISERRSELCLGPPVQLGEHGFPAYKRHLTREGTP
jgi:hypothetical protein